MRVSVRYVNRFWVNELFELHVKCSLCWSGIDKAAMSWAVFCVDRSIKSHRGLLEMSKMMGEYSVSRIL